MNEILQGIKYSFHVIFHPFDGFWCAKREKKGNVKAATVIIALITLVNMISRQITGFIFNLSFSKPISLLSEVLGIIVPVAIWCVANWGITTLLNGEGSMKDIYISTSYALFPFILLEIPRIIISRVIVFEEQRIYQALGIVVIAWCAFLLFTGLMVIHQYSVGKTVLTIIIAIVGMAVILFLFLLFFALIQQIINYAYIFYKEVRVR